MFGIGMTELLIILVVALLVLGPAKLPGVARSIGKGMRELRRASDDLRSSIMFDDDEPRRPYTPPPPPQHAAPEPEAITAADIPPHIHGSLAANDTDGPVAREDSAPREAAPAAPPAADGAPATPPPVDKEQEAGK
jgi:TatA/E family protein of Tat protein translocase